MVSLQDLQKCVFHHNDVTNVSDWFWPSLLELELDVGVVCGSCPVAEEEEEEEEVEEEEEEFLEEEEEEEEEEEFLEEEEEEEEEEEFMEEEEESAAEEEEECALSRAETDVCSCLRFCTVD